MRIPAARRRSGGSRLALAAALAVTVSAPPTSFGSVSAAPNATVCVGPMSVHFATPITPTPAMASNTITLDGSGTCTGQANGIGTWGGTGPALPGTACAGPVIASNLVGSIVMPVPINTITGNWAGGGTTAAQIWVFTNGTGTAVAIAIFAADPTQITSCITLGTATTISGTGVLVAFG